MSIDEANRKIRELEKENTELNKKIENCDIAIDALGEDQNVLQNLLDSISENKSPVENTILCAGNGRTLYARGAFYFGQDKDEGNSFTFNEMQQMTEELKQKVQKLIDTVGVCISQAGANIGTATNSKNEYLAKIEANNNEIANLHRWIAEEEARIRAEEEKEKEKEKNSYGKPIEMVK